MHKYNSRQLLRLCIALILMPMFFFSSLNIWAQQKDESSPEDNAKELKSLVEKAQDYFSDAEFGMAATYYKQALKIAPDDENINKRLQAAEGKLQEQKVLRANLPQEPDKREDILKQKYNTAKDLYSNEKFPEAMKAFYELWLLRDYKYKKAYSYLQKIEDKIIDKKREEELAKAKKEEEAKALAAQQQAEAGALKEKAEKYVEKGNEYLQKGKYDKARDTFLKALEVDKGNKEASEGYAKAEQLKAAWIEAQRQKELQEEQAKLQAEIEKKKEKAAKLIAKADGYLDDEKYDKALKYYTNALALDKDSKAAAEGVIKAKEMKLALIQAEQQAELQEIKEKAQKYVTKANEYLADSKYEKARKTYLKALEIDKTNQEAAQGITRVAQQEAAVAEAQRQKEAQEEEAKRKAELAKAMAEADELVKKGNESLADGDLDKAANYFNEALDIVEDHDEALAGLEKVKSQKEQIQLAEKKKQEIEEKVETQYNEGMDLFKAANYTAALEAFQAVLELEKDHKDAQKYVKLSQERIAEEKEEQQEKVVAEKTSKARELLNNKHYEEASALFNEVLELDKNNKDAIAGLADAREMMAREEEERAEEEKVEEAEEKEAEEKEAVEEKEAEEVKPPAPKLEEQEKELEEIERIREEVLEKTRSLTDKGKTLFEDGKYEEALEYFTEALELQPLYLEAQQYQKRTQDKIAEIKQEEELRKQEEQRLKEQKQQADALYDQAVQLYKQEQFDQAESIANEALQIMPSMEKATSLLEDIREARAKTAREEAEELVKQGKALFDQGEYQGAIDTFNDALLKDPTNEEASRYIRLSMTRIEERKEQEEKLQLESKKSEAARLFNEGLQAYQEKDLKEAVSKWEQALNVYPDLQEAKNYLERTRDEYQQYLEAKAREEEFESKEETAMRKLSSLVTIETKRPIPLRDFLRNLYIITDIDFYIAEGVEATVEGKFEDKPLKEVLDTVLEPIGLKWERKPGTDIIVVSPELKPYVQQLTSAQLSKIKALMDRKVLQQMLWGPQGEPSIKGVELTIDERESLLMMVDSKENIEKVKAFLSDLEKEAPPTLDWRSYKIDPQQGDKIKAILEALLEVEKPTPYSRERRILISGDELIIKDIPENILKAEEILTDRDFIKKIKEETLIAEVFDITPENATQENITQVEDFGNYVKTVVENMLYAKTGRSAAEAEGRRLWLRSYIEPPDKPKLTLTVVDYPSNIESIADLIARLPEVKKGMRSEIVYLKYASAADMATYLEIVLGITAGAEIGAPGGEEVRKTLSVEDEIHFRDISVRLLRVEANDIADDTDDSAEFVIRSPTTSEDVTIEEYRSEFIDDYEIVAEDIRPSGTTGQGRVKILIRYLPPEGIVEEEATPTPTEEVEEEEIPLTLEPFEDLNALLIQYTDPALYSQVMRWIEKLDMPTPQVSIEAKFVEVLENRAKEYSAEFSIMNLGEGVDIDSSLFNARFGQFLNEFRSELEPPVETTNMANLLKGTTIFNWIIAGGESPINYELRLLEAEGVINVVNGPTITVLNNETADFIIERQFGLPQVTAEGEYASGQFFSSITQVDLSVSPNVTQLGSITLDIDAAIQDFDANMGGLAIQSRPNSETGKLAVYHNSTERSIIIKEITTLARVQDGGTIVLGGWTGEHSGDYHSGVPILRNLPYIGQILFGRNLITIEKTTLLIFLTANVIK